MAHELDYITMNTTCDDLFSTINLRYFYGEPYTGIQNKPFTGIQNEPYTGIQNEPYTSIQNEPYTGIQNEPYTGIQNERGVRVHVHANTQTMWSLANSRQNLI